MKFLYVSTDSTELRELIDPAGRKNYTYNDIFSIKDGEKIAKRIGFNPMSSVSFEGNTSAKEIETIVAELTEKGLFTAIESLGFVKKSFPKDLKAREDFLTQSFTEDNLLKKNSKRGYYLMVYSNNPCKIRKA